MCVTEWVWGVDKWQNVCWTEVRQQGVCGSVCADSRLYVPRDKRHQPDPSNPTAYLTVTLMLNKVFALKCNYSFYGDVSRKSFFFLLTHTETHPTATFCTGARRGEVTVWRVLFVPDIYVCDTQRLTVWYRLRVAGFILSVWMWVILSAFSDCSVFRLRWWNIDRQTAANMAALWNTVMKQNF